MNFNVPTGAAYEFGINDVMAMSINTNGTVTASANFVASTGQYSSGSGYSGVLKGNVSNGASAIGTKIGNVAALATAGAKIISFYSDNLATEKAFIDLNGSFNTGAGTFVSSTFSSSTILLGKNTGFNSGIFNVDTNGNVSASGTLQTFGNTTLGNSDAAGGDSTRIYGSLALGDSPTGNGQLYISATSTNSKPLIIRANANQASTSYLTEWQDNTGSTIGYFASSTNVGLDGLSYPSQPTLLIGGTGTQYGTVIVDNFGQVMKEVMAKTQGQADGQIVQKLVKEKLNN